MFSNDSYKTKSQLCPQWIKKSRTVLTRTVLGMFVLGFIANCTGTEPSTTPPETTNLLEQLVSSIQNTHSELTIEADATDATLTTLRVSGLKNAATGTAPTWTIDIPQNQGFTTTPTQLTFTPTTVISAEMITETLSVTSEAASPVIYTLNAYVDAASVSDWITATSVSTYISATLGSTSATVTLTENTLTFTGLTNLRDTAGSIAIQSLPTGFSATQETITLPDPDGASTTAATITSASLTANTITIRETANPDNSQTYTIADIELLPDNLIRLISHIDTSNSVLKTSNPNFNVNIDSSDQTQKTLLISGLTNISTGTPPTWTIAIDQSQGITTTPTSIPLTASALISPENFTNTVMVAFDGGSAEAYTLKTQVTGAPVSDWITTTSVSTYVSATFGSTTATITLTGGTLTFTGLTNLMNGSGSIAIQSLPTGFSATQETITLPDPDGVGLDTATITSASLTANTITIRETANPDNSQTYTIADIVLLQHILFRLVSHIDTSNSVLKTSNPNFKVSADSSDQTLKTLLISGLTNISTGTPPTWTIAIDQSQGITTTPTSIPLTASALISPENFTNTVMVAFDGGSAEAYTLKTQVTGALVSDWITTSSVSTYISATLGSASATVTLTGGTLTFTGLTNLINGAGSIAIQSLPTGFSATQETITLPDPDGAGLDTATITSASLTANTITIRETANPDNSQTYTIADIVLLQHILFRLVSHIDASNSVLKTSNPNFKVSADSSDQTLKTLLITGLTNISTGTPPTWTIAIDQSQGITTTPTSIPLTASALISPENFTNTVMVAFDGGSAEAYTLKTHVAGAPIADWFTLARFNSYFQSVTYNAVAATLGFDGRYIRITGTLTNVPNGEVVLTRGSGTLPTGFSLSGDDMLTDPDDLGTRALNNVKAGTITISEDPFPSTGESTNTKNYDVIIVDLAELINPTGVELMVTGANIAGSPVTIGNGGSIEISEPCTLLATPTITPVMASTGSVVSAGSIQSLPRYYHREGHAPSGGEVNFVLPQLVTVETATGQITASFTINLQFPPCESFPAGSGTGTESDPYRIDNAPELELVSYLVNTSNTVYGSRHYRITTDIDLGSVGLPWDGSAIREGFPIIGLEESPFTGTFDCAANTISNLYIHRTINSVGLLGSVREATIKDCILTNVDILGLTNVGTLVGRVHGGTVTNSRAAGTVLGFEDVGGLIGETFSNVMVTNSSAMTTVTSTEYNGGGLVGNNYGHVTIRDSHAGGTVTGFHTIGGLVGQNTNNSTIINSYATGNVTRFISNSANANAGGLVGRNIHNSTVTNSYATGHVEGNSLVGGLVGYNDGSTIAKSYATGTVTGLMAISATAGTNANSGNVGGLVGVNYDGASISESYATGDASGFQSIGGLVGWNRESSSITDSYATGNVTGEQLVGGLVGFNFSSSTVVNSYTRSTVIATVAGGLFIGYNAFMHAPGNLVSPDGQGITDSYYNTETTFTVKGAVATAKAVGSDREASSEQTELITANIRGLTGSELQSVKGTIINGEAIYGNWDDAMIWEFQAAAYPRLRNVVCSNRQANPAAACN
ncbi:hypothetical protein COTS27_00793 [Spirochaetota bacterium]|nr:hypothetical protein COTS27_00793 [Spirochaetota bacterium]